MGLADILNGIDLKDIAMGMAVASHGDTAVPNVMKVIEQQRMEKEKQNQQRLTNEFLNDAFSQLAGGEDSTLPLLQKQRRINAMPETVPQYDMAGIGTPQVAGVVGLDEATTNVSNQAKTKASTDFIVEAQNVVQKMPNWADGVAYLRNKYRDKPVDSQLVSSALSSLYGKREAQILKGMEIADRQQARADTAEEKAEARKSKVTNLGKPGESYLIGDEVRTVPGTIKSDFAPVSKTLYGPKGQTKQVTIPKEGEYVPPQGWSLDAPTKSTADPGTKAIARELALERLKKIKAENASIEIKMSPRDRVDYNKAIEGEKAAELAKLNQMTDEKKANEAIAIFQKRKNELIKKYEGEAAVPQSSQGKEWKKWLK